MKKRVFAIAVIVICLSIITGSTFAFYTKTGTARNVITSGGVEVKVLEQKLENGTLTDYPAGEVPIMPATKVSKIVSVQSLQQPAWVRMTYTLQVLDENEEEQDIPVEELKKVILIDPDDSNWEEKNGWWYYKKAIKNGEITKPLFQEVVFSGAEMGNEYQGCKLKVTVVAQAVQKANNGATFDKAAGWPET